MELDFLPIPSWGTLSQGEREKLAGDLWKLLEWVARQYTMGESSSLPEEIAQELLSSLCFTLTMAGEGVWDRSEQAVERGRAAICRQVEWGKRLWAAVVESDPGLENRSCRETLESIESFFSRYDIRYFAHQVPCDIDYQLCIPVPEELPGICYVNSYLQRMLWENGVLSRFDRQTVIQLLKRSCPDYRGLLINLCQPVWTNAVGLLLAGGQPMELNFGKEERQVLQRRFAPLTRKGQEDLLEEGARRLCRGMGLEQPEGQKYLAAVARDLRPRLGAALAGGDLSHLFLSF